MAFILIHLFYFDLQGKQSEEKAKQKNQRTSFFCKLFYPYFVVW